jgi:hypothetical protein
MPVGRHYHDQIMFGFYRLESAYNAALTDWATGACTMQDFDTNTPHESWDDLVTDDSGLITQEEYPTVQEIVRQGVHLAYSEPRVRPNALAGLALLALGEILTTQDGSLQAFRHRFTPSNPLALPSMSAQVAHQRSSQFLYAGLKANTLTLANNGPYLRLVCDLFGSGFRQGSTTPFPPIVREPLLRWGDCWLYLRALSTAPLVVPAVPVQGSSNLGASAINISTRVLRMELNHPTNLWLEGGYRASSGMLRGQLLTSKRSTSILLELEVDTAREATELGWYLAQTPMAFEWQCLGDVIVPGGMFRWGATLILPKVQFRSLQRDEQAQSDTLALRATVLSDQANAPLTLWVYNATPWYGTPPPLWREPWEQIISTTPTALWLEAWEV